MLQRTMEFLEPDDAVGDTAPPRAAPKVDDWRLTHDFVFWEKSPFVIWILKPQFPKCGVSASTYCLSIRGGLLEADAGGSSHR